MGFAPIMRANRFGEFVRAFETSALAGRTSELRAKGFEFCPSHLFIAYGAGPIQAVLEVAAEIFDLALL